MGILEFIVEIKWAGIFTILAYYALCKYKSWVDKEIPNIRRKAISQIVNDIKSDKAYWIDIKTKAVKELRAEIKKDIITSTDKEVDNEQTNLHRS